MTTTYWYLTKGALGKYGSGKLRTFPQRPNEGPYIVDQDEGGSIILTDDNGNFLKSYERKSQKTPENMVEFIEMELNKLNFERPSIRTSYIGNKKKLPSRMMESEEYEDRKKKSTKSKSKRKICKCKK